MNLNSWVASTNPYISKKNKMNRLNLPLNTSYGLKNRGIVLISAMSQSLTCSVVTGKGSFDKFRGGSVMLLQDLPSGYTVKLTQLYTKRYWRNMFYLIWELSLTNQLYLCKITLGVTLRSLLRHFFLRRTVLLWSGLLKPRHESNRECLEVTKRKTKGKNPRNIQELWTNLKGEWEKISIDECKTLIRLYSKRCRAVIESKGLHIKY